MRLQNARIIFMGTPFFAKEILKNLITNNIKIELVVTQPDKLAGREKKPRPSEVKLFSRKHNLNLEQFKKLDSKAFDKIKVIKPDLVIVAAYGMMIPANFLDVPTYGFINIHTSLLPRLRGSSPIQTALSQGLKETGVTIMKIDKNLDSGDIIHKEKVKIEDFYKYLDLEKKLIDTTNTILTKTLNRYLENQKSTPQNHQKASFTKIIKKQDGLIDWNSPAKNIWNNFRAFHIWPKSFSFWKKGKYLKKITFSEIILSKKTAKNKKPGEVYMDNSNILVKTAKGSILIKKIQLEGKREMKIKDFLNGNPTFINTILK